MVESRRALFLLAWRIQELVIMCLVLVSSTDRNGQGKVAETFYMLFTNFRKVTVGLNDLYLLFFSSK